MRSCEWEVIWKDLNEPKSPFSELYYSSKIFKNDILKAIVNEKFFGILQVSIHAPDHVKADWKKINFAPIFKRMVVNLDQMSDQMQEFFKANKTKIKGWVSKYFFKKISLKCVQEIYVFSV